MNTSQLTFLYTYQLLVWPRIDQSSKILILYNNKILIYLYWTNNIKVKNYYLNYIFSHYYYLLIQWNNS